jgi:hypothetical protein
MKRRNPRMQTLPDERWHALRSGLAAQGFAQKTPNSASKSVKDEAQIARVGLCV